ncbi:MAG: hypothetical protein Q9168_006714 [Polycauliona sp. 1 TL-2023]
MTNNHQTQPIALDAEPQIPIYEIEAETNLDGILDKEIGPRDSDLSTLILSDSGEEEAPPTPTFHPLQRYQRQHVPGEAKHHEAHIVEETTDYTQLLPASSAPIIEEGPISPHLTGSQLSNRPVPGLVPAKRKLPRPPPPAPVERIPVKVLDPSLTKTQGDETSRARKVEEKADTKILECKETHCQVGQKEIRMSMFHPIVSGLDHKPTPLQQLRKDAISTVGVETETTFPYLPPGRASHPLPKYSSRPSHPQDDRPPTMGSSHTKQPTHRLQNPNFLTDAEYPNPKTLSRDGPGSRYPQDLLAGMAAAHSANFNAQMQRNMGQQQSHGGFLSGSAF